MSSPPAVSVVVPTHQRRASVVRLLDALRGQTLPAAQFEVVVAIDGSHDGTLAAVEGFECGFVLRAVSPQNRGRAAAVNAAVAAARGEVIVILDDDMEPAADLLAAHRREHAGPARLGVVGAAPVRLHPATASFARFTGARFNSVLADMAARPRQIAFAEAYTGNFSVRRTDFQRVGGFEEAFDGYGLEDYELVLRLMASGVGLLLSSEALAHQHYDKSFARAARDNRSRGRSAFIFAALHPSRAAEVVELRDPTPATVPRRVLRYVLPRVTNVVPIVPRLVVSSVGLAERRRVRRLAFVYELGLEYFYLLGLREASRDAELRARLPR